MNLTWIYEKFQYKYNGIYTIKAFKNVFIFIFVNYEE